MARDTFICEACSTPAYTLSQSYVDGSYQCAPCALRLDPYVNKVQRTRLEKLAREQKTSERRAEIARHNFLKGAVTI